MVTRTCRECDTPLEGVIERDVSLSALGYKNRDDKATCRECGASHTFGVPVDSPTDEPPACAVCGGRTYPYKVRVLDGGSGLNVHWKCEDCYYFENREGTGSWQDVILLGVQHLRGELDA